MVAKFLELNKPWPFKYDRKKRKKTDTTFLCMIALTNKMVAHTFLLSLDNANDHLSQKEIQIFCYHGYVTSQFSLLVKPFLQKRVKKTEPLKLNILA